MTELGTSKKKISTIVASIAAVAVVGGLAVANTGSSSPSLDPNNHTPCTVNTIKGPLNGPSNVKVYEFCGIPTTTTVIIPKDLPSTGTTR